MRFDKCFTWNLSLHPYFYLVPSVAFLLGVVSLALQERFSLSSSPSLMSLVFPGSCECWLTGGRGACCTLSRLVLRQACLGAWQYWLIWLLALQGFPHESESLFRCLIPAFSHSSYSSLDMVLRANHHITIQILSVWRTLDTFCHGKWSSVFSSGEVLVAFLTAASSACIWPNRLAQFSSHNCSWSYRSLLLSLVNEVSLALCPSFYLSECLRTFILTSIVWILSYLHSTCTQLTCRIHRPSFKELERLWRQKEPVASSADFLYCCL